MDEHGHRADSEGGRHLTAGAAAAAALGALGALAVSVALSGVTGGPAGHGATPIGTIGTGAAPGAAARGPLPVEPLHALVSADPEEGARPGHVERWVRVERGIACR